MRCYGWLRLPYHIYYLTTLISMSAARECQLPGMAADGTRENVSVNGESMPLGVVKSDWVSARVGAHLVKYLFELLGFNVVFSDASSSSVVAVHYIAGCPSTWGVGDDYSLCNPPHAKSHIAWEVWDGGANQYVYDNMANAFGAEAPQSLGSCGLDGTESMFITGHKMQEVYEVTGIPLAYYQSWNVSWNDVSSYFSDFRTIPTDQLKPCRSNRLFGSGSTETYLTLTGDVDGTELIKGFRHAKCEGGADGFWWLAPTCRSDPSRCVAVVSGGDGWGTLAFMQRAASFHMPLAIAVAVDLAAYTQVPRDYSVLFYWWWPDATFIDLDSKRVLFPPYDREAWSKGDERTDALLVQTKKYVHYGLDNFAHRAYGLLTAMVSSSKDMEEMLLDIQLRQVDEEVAACTWLQNNADKWSKWIPDETSCNEKSGMINDMWETVTEGSYFVDNRSSATGCDWCMPGRFSLPTHDERGDTYICQDCNRGKFTRSYGSSECEDCGVGRYGAPGTDEMAPWTDNPAKFICLDCAPGWSQSQTGQNECIGCGLGRFAVESGASACMKCPNGTSSTGNSTGCDFCERGTFASSGSPNCTSCPDGLVTKEVGSSSEADCLCMDGAYMVMHGNGYQKQCTPCLEGMACPLGSSVLNSNDRDAFPRVTVGYMTLYDEPLKVYKCSKETFCPGSENGMCAQFRDVQRIACGQCIPNTYQYDGECSMCSSYDVIPGIILFFGVLIYACTVAATARLDHSGKMASSHASLALMATVSIIVANVQTAAIYFTMDIRWQNPVSFFLELSQAFNFDVQLLKLGCLATTSPVSSFAFRSLIAPVVVMLTATMTAGAVFTNPAVAEKRTSAATHALSTSGTLLNIFFISVTLSAFSPFMCYNHPEGSGESVLSHPSVLCWESAEHGTMVIFAILGTLAVPVPFLALSVYGIWKFPMFLASHNIRMLSAFRFLYMRFCPKRYYFGIIRLVCNTLVCLIPAVFDTAVMQICLVSAVLMTQAMVQQHTRPWRSWTVNVFDGCCSCTMVFLLLCGSIASDIKPTALPSLMGAIALLSFAFMASVCSIRAVYLVCGKNKRYDGFICHHKQDAQAQSRFLKILLQEKSWHVFIDSDDLKQLDLLLDIVRVKVKRLIVFLTKDTLRRPWCAGEITTAYNCKNVQILVVEAATYVAWTPEQLENIDRMIDTAGCGMAQYGITLESIQAVYTQVLDTKITPHMVLRQDLQGTHRFADLVGAIIAEERAPSDVAASRAEKIKALTLRISKAGLQDLQFCRNSSLKPIPQTDGMVIVSCDPGSDEACASAGILTSKLAVQLNQVNTMLCNFADFLEEPDQELVAMKNACAIVVILSPGTMSCPAQLDTMVHAMIMFDVPQVSNVRHSLTSLNADLSGSTIIPVTLPGFEFPTTDYYVNVLPVLLPEECAEIATGAMQAFFRNIAVNFATNLSDTVLAAQAAGVLERILRCSNSVRRSVSNSRFPSESSNRDIQSSPQVALGALGSSLAAAADALGSTTPAKQAAAEAAVAGARNRVSSEVNAVKRYVGFRRASTTMTKEATSKEAFDGVKQDQDSEPGYQSGYSDAIVTATPGTPTAIVLSLTPVNIATL